MFSAGSAVKAFTAENTEKSPLEVAEKAAAVAGERSRAERRRNS